ncbi:hypothetical protein Tco_1385350 [Tanacetum coccineum]
MYPKDSPFDLEAYSDSDYAGASLDRKSTTGGCQFLGSRLISWQCKKQTIVANSTTEAEYVAAANCYGQVLWIQNQMLDYGYNFMNTKIFIDNESTICIVKNLVFHSKTKHIEIRHHFIRDSYEKRLIQVIKIHTDHNVADLLTKALDYEVPQPRSPTQTFIVDEIVHKERGDSVERAGTTATSLDAKQGSGGSPKRQDTILGDRPAQTRFERLSKQPHDSPLPRVNTLGSDEGSMTQQELMVFCTTLLKKVESLETDLKQTKQIYGAAYTKLIKKVQKLEKTGRKIAEIDQDPDISLVQHDVEIQGRYEHDMEFDFDFDAAKEVSTAERDVSTAEPVSTAGAAVTTASIAVSTVSPTRNTRVSTADDITMAETLVYIRKSAAKDKGKGKMAESETVKTKTKLQQEQERLNFEVAVRLQDELEEEERQRIARVHEAASSFNVEEWEDIQARVQADEELVQRLQAEEREKYTEAEQARMLAELINQRKRYFAAQRAEERRNKPPTQAQQRTYMSNYIKHIGGYTLQQLRGYSFDEIKTLFETTMRSVNTFVPIESEVDRAVPELAAGSSKRDAEEELDQESSKRQKTGESSELAEEPRDKEADELSQEELQQMMIIVPEQGMNVEALQTKYLIIDWEIYTEGTRKDDLVMLWSLVKEKFNSTEPTDDKEREIWVELKRLFEPDTDDELWKLQKHIHDLTWKLYDSCGVHHVSTEKGIDIYMLVEKEYPLSRGTLTLMLVAKLLVDQDNEMSRELLRKIFMQAISLYKSNRSRVASNNDNQPSESLLIKVGGGIHDEVGGEGLVASIACWRLALRRKSPLTRRKTFVAHVDMEAIAKKERTWLEELLKSKGMPYGSYPRFTVAVKGQKVTIKFQFLPPVKFHFDFKTFLDNILRVKVRNGATVRWLGALGIVSKLYFIMCFMFVFDALLSYTQPGAYSVGINWYPGQPMSSPGFKYFKARLLTSSTPNQGYWQRSSTPTSRSTSSLPATKPMSRAPTPTRSDKGIVHIFSFRVRVVSEDPSMQSTPSRTSSLSYHNNSSSSLDVLISSSAVGANPGSSLSFMKGDDDHWLESGNHYFDKWTSPRLSLIEEKQATIRAIKRWDERIYS